MMTEIIFFATIPLVLIIFLIVLEIKLLKRFEKKLSRSSKPEDKLKYICYFGKKESKKGKDTIRGF